MENKEELVEQGVRLTGDGKEIKEIVKQVVEDFDKPSEDADDDRNTDIDKNIAQELKKRIDQLTGSNWNIVVGSKFAVSAGIQMGDQYGHFKMNKLNIIIMEARMPGK